MKERKSQAKSDIQTLNSEIHLLKANIMDIRDLVECNVKISGENRLNKNLIEYLDYTHPELKYEDSGV